MTMEEILTSGLAELGVPATAAQLSQLRAYYTLLDERSKVMNLTAIEGEEATARLHFLDSAALLRYVRLSSKTAADIGSGAGFPGLVAAILAPDADITPEARDVPAGGVRDGRARKRHVSRRTCRGRERAAREL